MGRFEFGVVCSGSQLCADCDSLRPRGGGLGSPLGQVFFPRFTFLPFPCASLRMPTPGFFQSARGEAGKYPANRLEGSLTEKEARERSAAGQRQHQDLHERAGFRFQFVTFDLLRLVRFQREIAGPKKIEIRAATLAGAAMRLRVRAVRAFENQRGVAVRAELHAFRVRSAAFRAGHP